MVSSIISRTDGLVGGGAYKVPARVASTAALTLSGEQTVDGVAVSQNFGTSQPPDRVLVKNQADATQNGIYDVQLGAWLRSADFDGPDDVVGGTQTLIYEGTTNGSHIFKVTSANPVVIGTDDIVFADASIQGEPGLSILNGAGVPSSGLGENGEFYIDTVAHAIYGPKTAGVWGSSTSLVGPTGATGATGPAGPTGPSGGVPSAPQGRLTLQSGVPVMTADQTAKSTVYYDSYIGQLVPVWDGAAMQGLTIGSDEISLVLNATDNTSGHNYDVFAFSASGTLTIGTGPAWTSDTARGSGAGTTELQLKSGVWTNKNSIVLRSNGSSLGTIAANQATYLGTLRTTANAQTGMAFNPASASGGSNNILGLWNAYNRVSVTASEQDSTASWTYDTSTARALNNSTSNRISWVDGLAASPVSYVASVQASGGITTAIGVTQGVVDWTSGLPGPFGGGGNVAAVQVTAPGASPPKLGFHYVQQIEFATGPTVTFTGANWQCLTATLAM